MGLRKKKNAKARKSGAESSSADRLSPSVFPPRPGVIVETGTVISSETLLDKRPENHNRNGEISFYEKCRLHYNNGDYTQALHLYNQAVLAAPSNIPLRKERDSCRMLLGQIIQPDFLQEPMEKAKHLTQTQMIAYWRSPASEETGEYIMCFSEIAKSQKPTVGQELLINAYRSLYGWGGTVRNFEIAAEYFKKAIVSCTTGTESIEAEVKYHLALIWIYGEGPVKNVLEGLALLENVAYMNPKNPSDSASNYRRNGVAEAQCALGIYYSVGVDHGLEHCSYQLANLWLEKAHKNGNVRATCWLAFLSYHGLGLPKDEYMAECLWKTAMKSGMCKEAYIYLIQMYIAQMETTKAHKIILSAYDSGDAQTVETTRRLQPMYDAKAGERKAAEKIKLVEKFEKDNYNLFPDKRALCYRDKLLRATVGIACIRKAQEVWDNCQGKFSIQVSTFNECVLKNKKLDDLEVEMICHRYLDDLTWKSAIGGEKSSSFSMLNGLLYYSILLNILGERQGKLSVFAEDQLLAEELLDTMYLVLKHEPFYMKWQIEHARLIYEALNVISSATYPKSDKFKSYLNLGLGIFGSMVDRDGRGCKELINAWTFFDKETMPIFVLADTYYSLEDYNRSYIVLQEGLERFPSHPYFLYVQGMVCLRNQSDIPMGSYDRMIKATKCFEAFLNLVPKDHPKTPEAYYHLGKLYFEMNKLNHKPDPLCIDIVRHFYKLGIFAENVLLACFLPYKSMTKKFLEQILKNYDIPANVQEPQVRTKSTVKTTQDMMKILEAIVNQATNANQNVVLASAMPD